MNAITFVPPKTPRACRRDQSRGPQTPWSPRWLPTILAVVLMVAARGGGAAYGQTLTGLWEFGDSGNLAAATVGSDLTINGTSPTWNATETYGSTTLSGVITTIGGTANNLRAATGIGANGGGSRTNEYTFVWDVRTPGTGAWRSFFSTNLANTSDAEYFLRSTNSAFGRSSPIGYRSTLPANSWTRVVLTADLGIFYNVFKDGTLAGQHGVPAVDDGDYSLDLDGVLFFADDTNENQPLTIGSVAVYDGGLSAAEIAGLGAAGSGYTLRPVEWAGTSGDSTWDTTATNWTWTNAATATAFAAGDTVTFSDAAAEKIVTVDSSVSANGLVAANTFGNDYVLTGSGSVAVSGTLSKSGAGTFAVAVPVIPEGGTSVSAGTLSIADGGSLGGTIFLGAGGTLGFNRSDAVSFDNAISGDGGVSMAGGGTVTLTGAASYTGGTTVTGGTLRVTDGFGGTSGGISLDGGGLAIVSSATPVTLSLPSLALGANGSTLSFELPGPPGVAPLAVTNFDGLTLAAAAQNIAVASTKPLSAGTFTLIDYEGAAISSGFTLASLPPRVAAGLVYNTANTSIDLSVTGIDSIRWKGNLSNVWNVGTAVDVGGTDNWLTQSGGSATNFVDGDVVTFDDTADTFAVDIPETVVAGITVDNSINDYSFSGVGGIAGAGGITKAGTSRLTVSTANSFDGPVAVNAGSLVMGNATALGSTLAGTSVAVGATLDLGGQAVGAEPIALAGTLANSAGSASLAGPVELTGTATFAVAADVALSGDLTGSGSLVKTGVGRLALPATATYAGTTTVSAGTLAGSTANLPAMITNDGTVEFAQGSAGTYSGSITGSGSLAKTGAGQLTLASAGGFSGGVTISAGGVTLTDTTGLGGGGVTVSSTANDSVLFNFGSGTTATVANDFVLPVTSGTTRIFNIGGNPQAVTTVTLTGQLTGGSPGSDFRMADTNVTSNHRNVLVLDNAANSFEGQITFWRGYIAITSDGALGNAENDLYINTGGYNGGLRFAADGITLPATRAIQLEGSESIDTQAFDARIEGVISDGSLGKRGSGTLTLAAANTYAGGTRIFSDGGAVRITDPGSAGGGAITIDKAGTAGGTFETALTGTNTVTNTFGNFASATSLSAGGSAHIRNASGDTTLAANLNLGATGGNGINIESVAGEGNLLTIAGNVTSSVADSSRTHSFGGSGDGLVSGNILDNGANAVAIEKTGAGTWTLSGTNTYSRGTTVLAGTLAAGSAAGFGTGVVTVDGGALDLAGLAVANAIAIGSGGGTMANAAAYAGTQTIDGSATFATGGVGGTLNVNAGGILKGTGVTFSGPVSLATNATHAPGLSPGNQTFTGGLSYDAGSLLEWELSANTASAGDRGTLYDAIDVTGGSLAITAGAVIDLVFDQPLADSTASTVDWSDSFWDSGHAWTVIDFSGIAPDTSAGLFTLGTIGTDSFGQSLAAIRPQASFAVSRVGDDVLLSYAIVPEPASVGLLGIGMLGGAAAGARRLRRRRA
jgi:fibronectin-binding autotransporter adhesin